MVMVVPVAVFVGGVVGVVVGLERVVGLEECGIGSDLEGWSLALGIRLEELTALHGVIRIRVSAKGSKD